MIFQSPISALASRTRRILRRERRRIRPLIPWWRHNRPDKNACNVDTMLRLALVYRITGLDREAFRELVDKNTSVRRFFTRDLDHEHLYSGIAVLDDFIANPLAEVVLGVSLLGDRKIKKLGAKIRGQLGLPRREPNASRELRISARCLEEATRYPRDGLAVRVTRTWFRAALTVAVVLVIAGLYINSRLPDINQIRDLVGRPSLEVSVADDGKFRFTSPVFPIPVRYEDVPPNIIEMLVMSEDRRFWYHPGVDPVGALKALYHNLRSLTNGGSIGPGGSTITQQLARNLFLTGDKTIMRKIRELVLAFKLEFSLTKKEILELYLNRVYFGRGNYGIEQASRAYFGVRAKHLNLYQAAMLVGALPNPGRWNPERPKAAHRRAFIVLDMLVRRGELRAAERDALVRRWRGKRGQGLKTGDRIIRKIQYQFYRDWLARSGVHRLGLKPGGRYRILLTLDPLIQFYAQHAAQRMHAEARKRNAGQLAILVMSPDGAVRAMMGSTDYRRNQFNRVTQARRQPASAFKPFVYIAALEAGWQPHSVIDDRPVSIEGRPYPRNFDNRYAGSLTLTDALARSSNAAAVQLAIKVGPRRIEELTRRLGMRINLPRKLSMALGAGETTMLDLARAYAVLPNGGRSMEPYGILAAQQLDGRVVYWRRPPDSRQVLDEGLVKTVNRMLREVLRTGTGKQAAFVRDAAGKTGTSNDFRDAWFVGYTTDLVCALWLGNDDNTAMQSVTGGGLPARTWNNLMSNIYFDQPPGSMPGL